MQIPDSTPEEAVSTFRLVNGDAVKVSPDLRYQVVKLASSLTFVLTKPGTYHLIVSGNHCAGHCETGPLRCATRLASMPMI